MSVGAFSDLNIHADLIAKIAEKSIIQPTPIQSEVIPLLQSGQDMVAIAPTGTGKTLAYLLPVIDSLIKNPQQRALVLVPAREVADQIFKVLTWLIGSTMKTSLVVGGPPMKEQVSSLKKNPRVIVATPGRMLEHLKSNKLLLQNVKFLIIDEADRLMELGFIPQVENIKKTMRGEWQTVLFSATANPEYLKKTKSMLRNDARQIDLRNVNSINDKLKQKVYMVDATKKRELVLKLVQEHEGRILIFSYDQFVCEDVDQHLRDNGVSCDAIHGKQSAQQRVAIINNFRDGKYRVLVTTDLLARGLDIPDISCVINFDLPEEPDNFIHRVGRTARAGSSGTAISLVAKIDLKKMPALEPFLANAERLDF